MGETDHPTGDEAPQAVLDDGLVAAGFVAELRRRGVLRAVLAYAVVAFAVLQVVETVLHGLRLPDWILSAVVIALGVGFPITILVSWAFDLTLRGFERAAPGSMRSTYHARDLYRGIWSTRSSLSRYPSAHDGGKLAFA